MVQLWASMAKFSCQSQQQLQQLCHSQCGKEIQQVGCFPSSARLHTASSYGGGRWSGGLELWGGARKRGVRSSGLVGDGGGGRSLWGCGSAGPSRSSQNGRSRERLAVFAEESGASANGEEGEGWLVCENEGSLEGKKREWKLEVENLIRGVPSFWWTGPSRSSQNARSRERSAFLSEESGASASGEEGGGLGLPICGKEGALKRKKQERRFEVERLINRDLGRFAFLGTLVLGVGVGAAFWGSHIGDAEAATTSQLRNGALDVEMRALALGPEGPLLEEFWDNMRRYGLYFLTVVTGGVYTLVKPAIDALKNPMTAVLVIVVVTGSIFLVGLTVSAMLGITDFSYEYVL